MAGIRPIDPEQRAFDSDPFGSLSALLPSLQTTTPTYYIEENDYPASVSTFSSPGVGCQSRNASAQFDHSVFELSHQSGSTSTVTREISPCVPFDFEEAVMETNIAWPDLRKTRSSSKTADEQGMHSLGGSQGAELPATLMEKQERWPFFRRPSKVVVVEDVNPWRGAPAATGPRRLRRSRS